MSSENDQSSSALTSSSSEYSLNDGDRTLVRMLLEEKHSPKGGIDTADIDKYEGELDAFLKKLTSSTLERIPAETEQLMLDSVAVNDKMKVLAQQNYKTLLQNATCISHTFEGLDPLQSRLSFLSEKTPSLLVNHYSYQFHIHFIFHIHINFIFHIHIHFIFTIII